MRRSQIHLSSVSFGFGDANIILRDIDLQLGAGWSGVVGANGGGKTTLLRLLAGELGPSSGRVRVEPSGARIVVCRQTVERPDASVQALAAAADGPAWKMRRTFELEDWDEVTLDSRFGIASAGERKRWQVAAALWSRPDVLMLDEPTNHLDHRAREALHRGLASYGGIGVLVSHDRALLDRLCQRIVRLVEGRARVWPGGYTDARVAWQAEHQASRKKRADTTREVSRLAAQSQSRRERREQIAGKGRTSRRMKSRDDHDARSAGAKIRVAAAEQQAARGLATMRGRVDRLEKQIEPGSALRVLGGRVSAQGQRAPRSPVLQLRPHEVVIRGRPLRGPSVLWIEREARVWIRGANGAGKTTVLRHLAGQWASPPERLVSLPQEVSESSRRQLRIWLDGLAPPVRARTLGIVANLGSAPTAVLASPCPSPGEARKLLIAGGFAQQCWCLLLDEPTNHLDLPAIEGLESALEGFPGAIVLVTHDARFGAGLTTTTWTLAEGSLDVSER